MELTLNIYKKGKIEKTYTANDYELMFGTGEDIINLVETDKMDSSTNEAIVKSVNMKLRSNINIVKPIIKEVFPRITDAEIRHTRVDDISAIIIELYTATIAVMGFGINP